MPSVRVTLTYDEAESLLTYGYRSPPPGDKTLLRARGKIGSALLARRDYVSPVERSTAENLAPRVRRAAARSAQP